MIKWYDNVPDCRYLRHYLTERYRHSNRPISKSKPHVLVNDDEWRDWVTSMVRNHDQR